MFTGMKQFLSSEVKEVTVVPDPDFEAVGVVTCGGGLVDAVVVYAELKFKGGSVREIFPLFSACERIEEMRNCFLFDLIMFHSDIRNIWSANISEQCSHNLLHSPHWVLHNLGNIDISRVISQWPDISKLDRKIHIFLVFLHPSHHLWDPLKPLTLD